MAPYFLQNLVPKKEKVERARPLWEVLKGLTWIQWCFFFSGSVLSSITEERLNVSFDLDFRRWLAWTCDAIDFFSVSLTVVSLQTQFNRSTNDLVSHTFSNP